MTPAAWGAGALDPDDPVRPGDSEPTLVSLHFLRATLQRNWAVCLLAAAGGLLLAAMYLTVVAAPHSATTTLVLAHDLQQDPSRAMATDVSLLTTRTVAVRTMERLGVAEDPDDFRDTVTVEAQSPDVMRLRMTAESDAEAVRRLSALTTEYLRFRADQLTAQSQFVIDGVRERITSLQSQVTTLNRRIDDVSAAGTGADGALADTIAERASLTSQIENLRQQVQEDTLRTTSIVAASQVIDPAAAERRTGLRHLVLVLASGSVAGAALGGGAVLFLAITSDRLRRRSDVAAALGAPVPLSVRRLAPVRPLLRPLSNLLAVDERRAVARRRLAHVLEFALPAPGQPRRLVVAAVDNSDEVRFAVVAAGIVLAERGNDVSLVDLTEAGRLQAALAELVHTAGGLAPVVLRPTGIPSLAWSPGDLRRASGPEEVLDPTDVGAERVVLVLADVDPTTGAASLGAWADRAVVTVTSGRSSAERIRTAGELVREAGLELRCAVLLGTDRGDDSAGTAPTAQGPAAAAAVRPEPPAARRIPSGASGETDPPDPATTPKDPPDSAAKAAAASKAGPATAAAAKAGPAMATAAGTPQGSAPRAAAKGDG